MRVFTNKLTRGQVNSVCLVLEACQTFEWELAYGLCNRQSMNLRTKISEGRSERGSFLFEAWKILNGRVWKHALVGTPLWGALLYSTKWNLALRIPTRSFLLGRTLPIDLLSAWKAIARTFGLEIIKEEGELGSHLTFEAWDLIEKGCSYTIPMGGTFSTLEISTW